MRVIFPILVPAFASAVIASSTATPTAACPHSRHHSPRHFSIAVIPDTQNYTDFTHQTAQGFSFDANEMLNQELEYVADHAVRHGGPIAFMTAVGDVWEHQSLDIDPASVAKGYSAIYNPWFASALAPSPLTQTVELVLARQAYDLVAGKLPFSVVPGNHDYDAMYSDSRWPPTLDVTKLNPADPASIGELHIGGLDNFRTVFGSATSYFRDRPWYVSSLRGGADSAQVFFGAERPFLHIGLEMDPDDAVLAWASRVLAVFQGLPTIVTTHDYLNTDATRTSNPIIDPQLTDPSHNSPQDLWDKFLSRHDQIFMVLCGHEHGEAYRVDVNAFGHPVYQLLADYQDRGHVALERGFAKPVALGDGWIRLMEFDFADRKAPTVHVRTYSTYYHAYSTDLPDYASYYKASEAPTLADADYFAKGDFEIELGDFHRFDARPIHFERHFFEEPWRR